MAWIKFLFEFENALTNGYPASKADLTWMEWQSMAAIRVYRQRRASEAAEKKAKQNAGDDRISN